ncbi:hypothetical protein NLX69_02115 [Rossellomorea sp. BNER]|nr:hypothetical protein [Rossellomorea sp. BNER]
MDTSRYIHLNPVKANLASQPEKYPWSSYKSYVSNVQDKILCTNKIANNGTTKKSYQFFVEMNMNIKKY